MTDSKAPKSNNVLLLMFLLRGASDGKVLCMSKDFLTIMFSVFLGIFVFDTLYHVLLSAAKLSMVAGWMRGWKLLFIMSLASVIALLC